MSVGDIFLGFFTQSLTTADVRQQVSVGDGSSSSAFAAIGTRRRGEGGVDEPIHADLLAADDQVATMPG